MKSTKSDPKAIPIYTTQNPFDIHFLFLRYAYEDGSVEDFSTTQDSNKYDYPMFTDGLNHGYIDLQNGSIYILKGKKMYLWSFELSPAVEIPELALPLVAPLNSYESFATQNGVGFITQLFETFVFQDGQWKEGARFPWPSTNFELACATFIPENDNMVYITGGWDNGDVDVIYRYDIENDVYEEPGFNLRKPNRRHACTGFVQNGNEYLVVAGGTAGNQVSIYSIPDGSHRALQSHPAVINSVRMINFQGYFYITERDDTGDKIWRMKIEDDGSSSWEEFGKLEGNSAFTWIIPYNF